MRRAGAPDTTGIARSARPVSARREATQLAVVLAIATTLRVIYLVQFKRHAPYFDIPILDAAYYANWAERLLSGQGYGPAPFYLSPLYPGFLAVVQFLTGASYLAIYMIQAGLGLLTLTGVYFLGRRTFGHAAGIVAAVLMMFYAPILFMETKLYSETLALSLNVGSLLLLTWSFNRRTAFSFLFAGLVLGLATLCRSGNLLFVCMVLAIVAWDLLRWRVKTAPRWTGLMLPLGVLVSILPVTVRNAVVGRDYVLIQSNAGVTFAQGNNANAVGLLAPLPELAGGISSQQAQEMAVAGRAMGRAVKPSESSSYWFRRGVDYIRSAPGDYMRLLARKCAYALSSLEEQESYDLNYERRLVPALHLLRVPFTLILVLAIAGASGPAPDRIARRFLILSAGSVLLVILLFYFSSRYRLPALPALAALAGGGAVRVLQWFRNRAWWALAAVLAGLAVSGSMGWMVSPQGNRASVKANVAARLMTRGEADRGLSLLQEVVAENPQDGASLFNLGNALVDRGRADEARPYLERARDFPSVAALANVSLGKIEVRARRFENAAAYFQAALRIDPSLTQAHFDLGNLYAAVQAYGAAIQEYEAALIGMPDSPHIRYNMARVLMRQGRSAEAVQVLEEASRFAPEWQELSGMLEAARTAAKAARSASSAPAVP